VVLRAVQCTPIILNRYDIFSVFRRYFEAVFLQPGTIPVANRQTSLAGPYRHLIPQRKGPSLLFTLAIRRHNNKSVTPVLLYLELNVMYCRDLRSFDIRFEFESDVPIRIRFESDVPIRKFRISRTCRVPSYHKLRSLAVQQIINLCAVCS